ncbi:MAG: iron-sulfur cluster assembly scaffold protein [Desulfovibrionales bacterium]
MTDQSSDPFAELQAKVMEETRRKYGRIAYDRWINPKYMGHIESPDGYGRVTGSCGDTMEIFLRFDQDRVTEATYMTDGCGTSSICGSFAAELALGKDPDSIAGITGNTILEILGGLPEEDSHCAFLAAAALQEAVGGYFKKMQDPT